MTGSKAFIDTNIFVYLLSDDNFKRKKAGDLLITSHFISTQIVIECMNYCLKKLKLSKVDAFAFGDKLLKSHAILTITSATIEIAFKISSNYQFSWWDSLIVAYALVNQCDILYSEDLQHKQLIENRLMVINPFV